jgi:beta-galactosidase
LNETPDDTTLYSRTEQLVKSLDDSRQTAGATHGRYYLTKDYQHDVFAYDDYTTYTDGSERYPFLLPPRSDLPYLISESISKRSSPTQLYRRTDSGPVQAHQALAHAMAHDKVAADPRYCGLLAWSGIDYHSGIATGFEGVKYSGLLDVFRIPKPGAAIYRSQVDPLVRPIIEPAFYFDLGPGSPTGPGPQAMVCSNCARLEVFLGDEHLTTLNPDRRRFAHLAYPPFFLDLNIEEGLPELRIDGYLGTRLVTSRSFSSDRSSDQLLVAADDAEIVADGVDATRVVFQAADRFGAPRPFVHGDVEIELSGPGVLVGDSPFAFGDAGSAGAVWVRSSAGEAGEIRCSASHDQLGKASVTIASLGLRR